MSLSSTVVFMIIALLQVHPILRFKWNNHVAREIVASHLGIQDRVQMGMDSPHFVPR